MIYECVNQKSLLSEFFFFFFCYTLIIFEFLFRFFRPKFISFQPNFDMCRSHVILMRVIMEIYPNAHRSRKRRGKKSHWPKTKSPYPTTKPTSTFNAITVFNCFKFSFLLFNLVNTKELRKNLLSERGIQRFHSKL